MTPHIFSADGMQFVSGLFWQPLSGANRTERAKEIKALAKELSFDLHVVRTTATHCVGFASSNSMLRPGILSAAAVVSKTLEIESSARDFIFVSQLPDGKWMYVAQRDGVVLPDGDQSFPSEDGAKSRLLEDMSLGDWPMIVAPAIWGIRNSTERDFSLMLPHKGSGKRAELHRWWRLAPVDSHMAFSIHAGKIVFLSLFLIAAFLGYRYYQDWQHQKEMERLAAIAAMQQDEQGRPLPPEHPWKKIPLAADILQACTKAFRETPLFPGNWDISSITCTPGNGLMITWRPRANAWIEHLKVIIPKASIAADGSTASLSIPINALASGSDEAIPEGGNRLSAMHIAAQRYGVKLTATSAPPPPPSLPGQGKPVQLPPDWAEITWKVNDVTFPEVILAALNGGGFRMTAMSAMWTGGKFVWTMEGTQYVQP